jgi:type IV pilus assembly protein PilB
VAYSPSREELDLARFPWRPGEEEPPALFRAVGCSGCAKTGYKGRLALHEVMSVSEEIERLTVSRASSTEVGGLAREQGMTGLREDGMEKVRLGATSIEEIMRVVV